MHRTLRHPSLHLFVMLKTQFSNKNPRHYRGIQKSIAFLRPVNANGMGLCYWTIGGYMWLHSDLPVCKFPYVSSFSQTRQVATDAARISLAINGVFGWSGENDFGPWKRRNMWARLDDLNIFKKNKLICPFEVPKTYCNCERRSNWTRESNGKHVTSSCCTIFVAKNLDDQLDSDSSAFRGWKSLQLKL